MSGNEYLLKCEVSGKLVEVEENPSSPESKPVIQLALDNVVFSNCELMRLYGQNKTPLMSYKFESLFEAPNFILQKDLNEFENEAEEALYEELKEERL